jgi:hypothetical protein
VAAEDKHILCSHRDLLIGVVPPVANLADNSYLMAFTRKGFAEPFLGETVGYAVNLRGVKEVDPRLKGSLDNREGGALVYLPPMIADVSCTEPDSRCVNPGISELTIDHLTCSSVLLI